MDKKTAIRELNNLADEVPKLVGDEPFEENHTRWMARVLSVLEEVFGRNSRFYLSFAAFTWQKTGGVMIGGPAYPEEIYNPRVALERLHREAYKRQLKAARGLLLAAVDEIKRADNMESLYDGKNTEPETSTIVRVINLADRSLRKVIKEKPENETVVQDAFEALLVGADITYSREAHRTEYSSKTYVPDFTCERQSLAIEIKLCASKDREKKIIAEINDDIRGYSTEYKNKLFVVYDIGNISDVDRFKKGLEDDEGVIITVVKH